MNKLTLPSSIAFVFLIQAILLSIVLASKTAEATQLTLRQVLEDGKNGIDGLDNPRQVKVSPDGRYVGVTSADDNALLILSLQQQLTPLHVFKNAENRQLKLEGATGLTWLGSAASNGNHVGKNKGKSSLAVASFYDSAVSLFHQDHNQRFLFNQAHSDGLSYERIFKNQAPITTEDKLGLLGAWDLTQSTTQNQLFTASYQSDAIAIFAIQPDSTIKFKRKLSAADLKLETLGRPITLVYSEDQQTLIVAGHQGNTLNVLATGPDGNITLKQSISNNKNGLQHLINPQKLLLSKDQQTLYVACAGSSAILVFQLNAGQYQHHQTFIQANEPQNQQNPSSSGLKGIGSMVLSSDGSQLFAAGEFDQGLLQFDIKSDGRITLAQTLQFPETPIEGVTSIATTADGRHLIMTLGKRDALYLLEIVGGG